MASFPTVGQTFLCFSFFGTVSILSCVHCKLVFSLGMFVLLRILYVFCKMLLPNVCLLQSETWTRFQKGPQEDSSMLTLAASLPPTQKTWPH